MARKGAGTKQREKVERAKAAKERQKVVEKIRAKGDEPIQGAGSPRGGFPSEPQQQPQPQQQQPPEQIGTKPAFLNQILDTGFVGIGLNPAVQKVSDFFDIEKQIPSIEGRVTTTPIGIGLGAGAIQAAGKIGDITKGVKLTTETKELLAIEKLIGKGTARFSNQFVENLARKQGLTGKQVGALTRQIGEQRITRIADIALSQRFPANVKSVALTRNWLVKSLAVLGVSAFTVKTIADLYGTYPFASFGKEETLQYVGFPMSQAIRQGRPDIARELLDQSNEILNATPTIAEKIPYANVQKEFKNYITAQTEVNIGWEKLISDLEQKQGLTAGSQTSKEIREAQFKEEGGIVSTPQV